MSMLCFSEWLRDEPKYRHFWQRLEASLSRFDLPFTLLPQTKDIWCRDYLPIYDAEGQPVQFRYRPSYLNDRPQYRTEPSALHKILEIFPRFSDLNLDGGNLLLHRDSAIVTRRVYTENPDCTPRQVEAALIEALKLDRLIVIPDEDRRYDMTGHADGMCRWLDDQTVLLGDYTLNPRLEHEVKQTLKRFGIDTLSLKVEASFYRDKRDWLPAINYLEYERFLFVPVLGVPEEEPVLESMREIFPAKEIVPVLSSEVVRDGGALNCITWISNN